MNFMPFEENLIAFLLSPLPDTEGNCFAQWSLSLEYHCLQRLHPGRRQEEEQ